jgi:outer membrane biosynthesis protein TonB
MFWNGTRWIDERPHAAPPPPSRRRSRDWLATGVMILGVVALAIPFVATSAASRSADRLITAWSGSYQTRVFQESTVLAKYVGTWNRQQGDQFMGSYAAISTQADAAVDFSFTGSGVSWIGPEGPNQGKARVYVDGRYVRTVDTYSRNPRPRESLFTALFSDVTDHTLSIHVLASTAGRVVTVDAFAVRDPLMVSETSTQMPAAAPTPTPMPAAAPTATPVPTPTPMPAAAPTATPVPTPTPMPAAAPTATPTPTTAPAPTATVAPTPTPTVVPMPTPSVVPTPTATVAPTPVPTPLPTPVLTAVSTPVPTAVPTPVPTPTLPPAGTSIYGPGVAADTLGNEQVGGTDHGGANTQVSYRFRATESSALTAVRVYIQSGAGYGGGTGGTLVLTVQPDDGTGNHYPTPTVLASSTLVHPGSAGAQLFTFSSPAVLTAGQLYHIVWTNTDPAPVLNFVSTDGLWNFQSTTPRQPFSTDTDWAQLHKTDANPWTLTRNATPILGLVYANGKRAGMGYMEVWVRNYVNISGSTKARESFTLNGPSRSVSTVSVRLKRVIGSSPLMVRLETASGVLIEEGAIPAASIAVADPANNRQGPTWVTYTFTSPRPLTQGQAYNLVLSSSADTSYSVYVVRKGVEYQYGPGTYFADGHAQYSAGSGWVPFTQDGGGPLDEGDLQFYFR